MSNIIFDFDGTIANSLPVILKLFYKWSGREPLNADEIETLRNMPAREVIKAVGVPMWRAPSLIARGRKDFAKHIDEIEIFSDMPEVIRRLNADGHKLYLMSSNSKQNVQAYLVKHDIDKCFNEIYGSVGLFSKARAMNQITKRHKIKKSECYSVGDETRDIDAAKKAGLISVSVAWGFNGQLVLLEHNPDYLIHKPTELLKLVK